MTKSSDNSHVDVLLVGYERQENLGLRSIMAYLDAQGCISRLVPFWPDDFPSVLEAVKHYHPRLIGFSLIFQYTLDEFSRLMSYLRTNGVDAHFTAGGHFPSLRPEDTLKLIPELDSVVRFEGELTLHELLMNLGNPGSWKQIPGLAFRINSTILITESRPFISDLDSLPLLSRDEPKQIIKNINVAAMLGSRGCLFNCSFCSIREFYGASKGPLRRIRSPKSVIDEMLLLYHKKNVRFFSFQDDDFAAKTISQQNWLKTFLEELDVSDLKGNIAWKISCRVDDLNQELLRMMIAGGLTAVYLGVESGNESGLHALNKNVSVEQNILAIDLLKQHNVALAIGFMLFDPSSTVDSVKQNISFLRKVGGDGYFPVNFCKMLPYAGTPIEKRLSDEGRLKGTVSKPDYEFNDPVLDWYEFLVQKMFSKRNFSPDGIVTLLQQADFDMHLYDYFYPDLLPENFGKDLKELVAETNILALNTLETLLDDVLKYGVDVLIENDKHLIDLFDQEWRGEMNAEVKLKKLFTSAKVESYV
jgi:anaerobic magnesium-protoporphyrin IX monomethyl ester cyclase